MPQVIDYSMVTTANELPGYRLVRNVGLVRGLSSANEVAAGVTEVLAYGTAVVAEKAG